VSNLAPHLDEFIEMNMSFVDLKLFARLMVQIVRRGRYTCPQYIEISLKEAENLFPLIKKYDCTRMQDRVRQRVLYLAKDQPWEVLIMACNMDDIPMAQVAISHLSGKIHTTDSSTPDTSLWQNLAKLSGPWALEFIRLYMPATLESRCPLTYRTYVGAIMRDDFGTWAMDFNPGRRM
jgi:hypothetical protein